MKNKLIALCLLLFSAPLQAQEATEIDKKKEARQKELMMKKVEMDVDEDLFLQVTPNAYVSETPKAVIMAMLIPETYANSKKKMEDEKSPTVKFTAKGEKEVNGVKVYYLEGVTEAEGKTLKNTIYCVEVDAETCLMFIATLEKGADKKYEEAITKAAHSAIKKK